MWNHMNKRKLSYIGYKGTGDQIRDVLFIDDFCRLVLKQTQNFNRFRNNLFCIGGGAKNAINLKRLTFMCEKITGNKLKISKKVKTSIYDIPYYISNNNLVTKTYNWKPKKNINNIVNDVFIWLKNNKYKIKKYF